MTIACADLDSFFDGELGDAQAAAFRDHVGGCNHCQRVLHGRMQEAMLVDAPVEARVPVAPVVRRKRIPIRALAVLIPMLGAAAVAVVTLTNDAPAPRTALQVELAIDPTGPTMRGTSAHPGDTLRVTARGALYRAIWVYRDERTLVAVCPGASSCRAVDGGVGLELVLSARGTYAVVTLGAASDLPTPTGSLDADLDAASRIDVSYQIGHVEVY